MSDAWVAFRPLDAVTFRDGRPFSSGLSASARTTLPRPTSTGGALKAAFGGREPDEIVGPLVVDLLPSPVLRFPAPADLVFDDDGQGRRLHPDVPHASHSGIGNGIVSNLDGQPGVPANLRLLAGSGRPAPVWIRAPEMEQYLSNDVTNLCDAHSGLGRRDAGPFGLGRALTRERRLGLAREGRAVRQGFLYTADFLRFAEEGGAFACRASFGDGIPTLATNLVRLGGEARQAEVAVVAVAAASRGWLPAAPPTFPDGRVALYVATPAIFARGWLPDPVPGHTFDLVAATVMGPEVSASWTPGAPRPNPVRWAVAAGSVYLLELPSADAAAHFANEWHGRCLPQADERLRTAGFGMCLIGRW